MNPKLILILVATVFISCNDADTVKTKAALAPQFYYYPRANVYFDSANKDFIFMGSEGNSWQSQKQIPAAMQALMDKSVFIAAPATPVWKDNANHKLVYSSLLYASANDTVEKKEAKPVAKKLPPQVKKEKKGLKKLIDKLFGRRKKDDGR